MNTKKETGVMDCTLPHKKTDEVWTRILSGLLAVGFTVSATYAGFPYFDALGILVLAGLLREWSRLTLFSAFHPVCWVALIQTLVCLYVTIIPLWANLTSIGILSLLSLQILKRAHPLNRSFLFLGGCFYLCLPVFVFMFLSHRGMDHSLFLLWTFSLVWAADTGAYFTGRALKGPKLAIRISPNKTWSGFFGGTLWAILVGIGLNPYFGIDSLLTVPLSVLLLGIPLAAHAGDLLESGIKRYFGVKDSGSLIPGHGGLLDRLDSLLLVGLLMGLFISLGWIG